MGKNLEGVVAVVTGASRGAGKGIALALGAEGATVYVTGRSRHEGDAPLPGTVQATADAVTQAGGKGVAVCVDHANDEQVRELFERVRREHGKLDILVNNATAIHDDLIVTGPFWEKSPGLVDILDVGLRSGYVASYCAAPLLLASQHGLVVFTSSFGANCYMHGPAYGAQKAGVDKFAHDMAVDFKPFGVAVLSIWMGMLKTDRTRHAIDAAPEKFAALWDIAESPEFTGRVIAALYRDPALLEKSGQVLVGAEAALAYGIKDIDGKQPPSHRATLGGPAAANPAIVR